VHSRQTLARSYSTVWVVTIHHGSFWFWAVCTCCWLHQHALASKGRTPSHAWCRCITWSGKDRKQVWLMCCTAVLDMDVDV
jgi:hypothetical protein